MLNLPSMNYKFGVDKFTQKNSASDYKIGFAKILEKNATNIVFFFSNINDP